MDLIIQAILRIFEAAFEKDATRRKGQAREPQKPAPPAKRRRTLEEWLAENLQELEAEMKPEAPPRASPKPAPRAAPPVIPAEQRDQGALKPADGTFSKPIEAMRVTPIEAMQVAPLSELDADRRKQRRVRTTGIARNRVLPGKSALEQMIIAQTILGPCRAQDELFQP